MKHKNLINKKVFNIKGKKYKIKYLNDYKEKMPKNTEGIIYFEKNIIYIDNTLPEDKKLFVLLHELIHAVLNECKLNLVINSEIEELIIENVCDLFISIVNNVK